VSATSPRDLAAAAAHGPTEGRYHPQIGFGISGAEAPPLLRRPRGRAPAPPSCASRPHHHAAWARRARSGSRLDPPTWSRLPREASRSQVRADALPGLPRPRAPRPSLPRTTPLTADTRDPRPAPPRTPCPSGRLDHLRTAGALGAAQQGEDSGLLGVSEGRGAFPARWCLGQSGAEGGHCVGQDGAAFVPGGNDGLGDGPECRPRVGPLSGYRRVLGGFGRRRGIWCSAGRVAPREPL
jgi:hypothetical protein